jgi:hypothetical protein
MATDGVKIIDGDLAHDTYWGIMDLYDSNISIEEIRRTMPFIKSGYGHDEEFYHEIFVTSYALAFWEIGGLTEEMLAEVKSVIEIGAGVKDWTKEVDEKTGKARQKELDKLLKKISQPNAKIRARKKYRKITNFHFQADDVLCFKLEDDFYRVVVCAKIDQHRGKCDYMLTPIVYKSKEKPSIAELIGCDISGTTIGSGYTKERMLEMQPGVDTLWPLYPASGAFFVGLVYEGVGHKNFVSFKHRFEKVGTLKIKEGFNKSNQ